MSLATHEYHLSSHEDPLASHENRLEAQEERDAQVIKSSEALGRVNNIEDAKNVEAL